MRKDILALWGFFIFLIFTVIYNLSEIDADIQSRPGEAVSAISDSHNLPDLPSLEIPGFWHSFSYEDSSRTLPNFDKKHSTFRGSVDVSRVTTQVKITELFPDIPTQYRLRRILFPFHSFW